MASTGDRKIFAGPRIRRLRRELGLTQARMAEELGFSSSYLNLVERNQRPVSAQFLLRLAEVYDMELRTLAGDDEAKAFADLVEVFSDPLFKEIALPKSELQELASVNPEVGEAVSLLYRAYRKSSQRIADLTARFAGRDSGPMLEEAALPLEEVRNFIHSRKNHFPRLDEAAEELHEAMQLGRDDPFIKLRERLRSEHGVEVRVAPTEVMSEVLRHYDRHRTRLMFSELLDQPSRNFQIAYQIGCLEYRSVIEEIVASARLTNEDSIRLCRINITNYFAGALLMPYEKFLARANELNYDIEILGRRFGTGFEQVCHRLTTLQRPGARGIPFFFIRVDNAGNVSKRFSAGRFHFSKFGGTCPLWDVHNTFHNPGKILTQIVRMPDETTYFSIARTVRRAGSPHHRPAQQFAIGLGCDLSYARRLVYARGHDLEDPKAVPIGLNCRLCERPNCAQRAYPPLSRPLVLDERVRGISPFSFSLD